MKRCEKQRWRVRLSAAWLGLWAVAPCSAQTQATAKLVVPEAAVTVVAAKVSLPVSVLAAAAGTPAPKDSILVVMEKDELQRELKLRLEELDAVRSEMRFRTSNREVRGGGGGTTPFSRPDNSIDTNLAMREADLTRDLLEVQTKLSLADVRALDDGYVVRHLVPVGVTAKKRKPVLSFVRSADTEVLLEVQGGEHRAGEALLVTSVASGSRFHATVAKATPTGAGSELVLRPQELPFLSVGVPEAVIVSAAD